MGKRQDQSMIQSISDACHDEEEGGQEMGDAVEGEWHEQCV